MKVNLQPSASHRTSVFIVLFSPPQGFSGSARPTRPSARCFWSGSLYLVEAVVQRQRVVPQQLLLLEAEQPLAERQAGPRHRRGVVLHVELVGKLVGRQLPHCNTSCKGRGGGISWEKNEISWTKSAQLEGGGADPSGPGLQLNSPLDRFWYSWSGPGGQVVSSRTWQRVRTQFGVQKRRRSQTQSNSAYRRSG